MKNVSPGLGFNRMGLALGRGVGGGGGGGGWRDCVIAPPFEAFAHNLNITHSHLLGFCITMH